MAGRHADIVAAVGEIEDATSLRRVCQKIAEECGVTNLVVGVVEPSAAGVPAIRALVETFPLDLSISSLKRRHANYTPMILELLEPNQSFDSSAPPVQDYVQEYERVWEEYRQFARCDYYYAVPVHDEGVVRGWASYMADRPFESAETATALSVLTASAYERMLALAVLPPPRSPLTRRQSDALSYCAQGKSDWEIGEALGISEATAHEHIETAKRRLGVRTRIQAAVIAVQRGWIKP